ncbi:MAG TPA: hypothetical protein VIJ96_03795, partial [Acidothermaceae bacterium]
LLASAVVATLLGHNSPTSAWSALATLPIAAWEFSLGVRLIVKGFSPSPIISGYAPAAAAEKELVSA